MSAVLEVERVRWRRNQLSLSYRFDGYAFATSYWYPDVDLDALDRVFGRDFMERVHVHTALFEAAKITSLRADAVSLGPYARHATPALAALFAAVHRGVWAQWRFENDLPDEGAPTLVTSSEDARVRAVRRAVEPTEALAFCGGGKDSLVALKLLERTGVRFATLGYASSVYGATAPQFALLDALLDRCAPVRRHRQVVLDDFSEAPVIECVGAARGARTITACETPSSVFAAIPVALAHGYGQMVFGNEASANRGNLRWDRTGEEVNHQWGKSLEAEAMLGEYVRRELVSDLTVFSVLMPLHDVLIFELLRRDEDSVRFTHSCNVRKPWCRRCAKCAYVWLGMRAHLEHPATTDAMFGEDLLEAPENEGHFRALVGLEAHTPFECVGRVEEARLALSLLAARGLLGPRGRSLAASVPAQSPLDELVTPALDQARIPEDLRSKIAPLFLDAGAAARARIARVLSGAGR